jgi:hypothetical protein
MYLQLGPDMCVLLLIFKRLTEVSIGTFDDMHGKQYRFRFNTQDRAIQTVDTGIPINFEQVQTLVHQDPDSYWIMYAKYRQHWPNYILVALILLGEGAIAAGLRRFWLVMQQRTANFVVQ